MFFVILLMLIQPVQAKAYKAPVDDAFVCLNATTKIEKQYEIKKHLLTTISSVETGRYIKEKKQTLAWPWTINAQGKGMFFKTKAEAIREAKRLQARGIKSFDVGCMQINMAYHGDAFKNIEEAFDPEKNVAYAAKFLRNLYENKNKDWVKAAMAYHSSVPKKALRYKKKLASAYERIRLAQNDFDSQLFGNALKQVPERKPDLARVKISQAKESVRQARINAHEWREARLAEYRKNKIK